LDQGLTTKWYTYNFLSVDNTKRGLPTTSWIEGNVIFVDGFG
jgi:hypothetical protein